MKLVSWNVNGLRAAIRSGFDRFLADHRPDVLCLQEVKAQDSDVPAELFDGYHVTWNSAAKKGYSGVLVASREKPLGSTAGIGLPGPDDEGRVITTEWPDFYLVNVYTPNSQRGLTRLDYRMTWDAAFLDHVKKLDAQKPVLFCGDMNVAHQEIDLANPKQNRKNAGFTDEERAGFSRIVEAGFVDVYRERYPGETGHYTWWTWRSDARARNIGWRIDYWLASQRLAPRVANPTILKEVHGSDHCPVSIEIA